MPTSNEVIPNRPLSGTELKRILTAKFAEMLDRDGLLSSNVGFGRLGYRLRADLYLDLPSQPQHRITVESAPPARNERQRDGDIPLDQRQPPEFDDPTPDAVAISRSAEGKVESPNRARIENRIPVQVTSRDPETGIHKTREITYDPADLPDPPTPDTDTDHSADETGKWKQRKGGRKGKDGKGGRDGK